LSVPSYTDANVTAGMTYYYQVTAVDSGGESARSAEAFAVLPGAPPAAPTNLTAAAGSHRVSLNWTPSAGAPTYTIYRGTGPGGESGTPIAMNVSGTTYSDLNLMDDTTYYYQVTAVNINGESPRSLEVFATPHEGTVPAAPTALLAVPGNGQVRLSWTGSAGAGSYNVYRGTSPSGEESMPVATGVLTPLYNDIAVTNGTTYYYQVTAVNAFGESGPSNEMSAMPQQNAPPPPPNKLSATPTSTGVVSLSWTASPGATTYNVYRATTQGGEGNVPLATGVTGLSFTDLTAANGTTYY
jgi:fibronectin type 3 domain-containing protein